MVIAIGTGVIKANEPKVLMEVSNSRLSISVRNVLKKMDWVKRKGTAAKVELNLDQTNSFMFSQLNIHLIWEVQWQFPSKVFKINRKHHIYGFCISLFFLTMQFIYNGKTKSSLPKYNFPNWFTFTSNLWSNFEKYVKLWRE